MFVEAIERVGAFTRPIHTITRLYGHNEIVPGSATLFFVNRQACAVTCRHVAELILHTEDIYKNYNAFQAERRQRERGVDYAGLLRKLEEKYKLKPESLIRVKNIFQNCVDQFGRIEVDLHPTQDLALLRFRDYGRILYENYAVFGRMPDYVRPGRWLCRLGYPFPDFTNFQYNQVTDDIEWTDRGRINSPYFPIDGIVTRLMHNGAGNVSGVEMSTPGLRGQSGGPLFDAEGRIWGMQAATRHIHLGFDIEDREVLVHGRKRKVANYPFLHVGICVHGEVIKQFLADKGVEFFEE